MKLTNKRKQRADEVKRLGTKLITEIRNSPASKEEGVVPVAVNVCANVLAASVARHLHGDTDDFNKMVRDVQDLVNKWLIDLAQ